MLSGLIPNQDKSCMFICGVESGNKESLLDVFGYNKSKLPIKCLGVPLITTKAYIFRLCSPCRPYYRKARSWMHHTLSYAGRLQLIKSILFSIQVYWSSLFNLSKDVVLKITSLLRSLLGKGCELASGGVKMAWENICLPKEEGGLGVKNIQVLNRATMVKHIWAICTNLRHSIWSSWIHSYLFRGRNI